MCIRASSLSTEPQNKNCAAELPSRKNQVKLAVINNNNNNNNNNKNSFIQRKGNKSPSRDDKITPPPPPQINTAKIIK